MPDPSEALTIGAEPPSSPAARTLIAGLDAELTDRYPAPEDNHLDLPSEQLAESQGVFLVARMVGQPVACGALRRIGPDAGEVERMYVLPAARGLGIGRRVLAGLEEYARQLKLSRLVLETGQRQPEAMALYEHAGYSRIDRFGEYVDSPASVCMGKQIDQ